MATYPMPACGIAPDTKHYQIDDLRTIRMPNSLYGVANGSVKEGWALGHAVCTWAEVVAIKASYTTNRALSSGTVTFVWPGDGATKTVRWVGVPQITPIANSMFFRVISPLEE